MSEPAGWSAGGRGAGGGERLKGGSVWGLPEARGVWLWRRRACDAQGCSGPGTCQSPLLSQVLSAVLAP